MVNKKYFINSVREDGQPIWKGVVTCQQTVNKELPDGGCGVFVCEDGLQCNFKFDQIVVGYTCLFCYQQYICFYHPYKNLIYKKGNYAYGFSPLQKLFAISLKNLLSILYSFYPSVRTVV